MYYVYLLECKDNTIYTGITTDPKRRLRQHQEGTGARYTRSRGAVKMLYTEKCKNRSAALKREIEIKKMPRLKKLRLVNKTQKEI